MYLEDIYPAPKHLEWAKRKSGARGARYVNLTKCRYDGGMYGYVVKGLGICRTGVSGGSFGRTVVPGLGDCCMSSKSQQSSTATASALAMDNCCGRFDDVSIIVAKIGMISSSH